MFEKIMKIINSLSFRNEKIQLNIKYDSRETLKLTSSIIMKFVSRGLVNMGDFEEVWYEENYIHGYILNVNKTKLDECLKLCRSFNLQVER